MQGHEQALAQILLGVVLDEVQLVEAGVGRGQAVTRAICLVDLELLGPRDALHKQMTSDRPLAKQAW